MENNQLYLITTKSGHQFRCKFIKRNKGIIYFKKYPVGKEILHNRLGDIKEDNIDYKLYIDEDKVKLK